MDMSARVEPAVAGSLAEAVIASSHTPLLLLNGELRVVAASNSFCRAFQIGADAVVGRALQDLGRGEWSRPGLEPWLASAVAAPAGSAAFELDLKRPGRDTRSLILHVEKLAYADRANVRLLLAVSDVTEERLNLQFTQGVLQEQSVLLQELQHRVANSLQIIASVLMQSARRAASEEARRHLYDAHHRVMSVASLQRHLAATREGDVELRAYLIDLCDSISASMIHDPDHLSIEVRASPCVTTANASMSMGLIVTELVINAIKHGFPGHRRGRIFVDYEAEGSAWSLSVADDGVGVAADPTSAPAGLGTSIVQALARQLKAEVTIAAGNPGTIVRVVCRSVVGSVEQASALNRLAI